MDEKYYLLIGIILFIILIVVILILILRNPFKYPYKNLVIDISGKRKGERQDKYLDEIDRYINKYRINGFMNHYNDVNKWKRECVNRINSSVFKSLREKQYLKTIDDEHMFKFRFIRKHTRYRQSNYVRYPYTVEDIEKVLLFSFDGIVERYKRLYRIDFACTLSEYNSKNQRKLMTPELKKRIKLRDNYTCQICGKYMPDEVGLHIDHIIPINKGGKSVADNLQVLCDKCNLRKSNKA